MISNKEEFIALYKKFQEGQCTPQEIEQLESYRDEMQLMGDTWENDAEDEQAVRNRVWARLHQNMERPAPQQLPRKYTWLKVAALLLLATSVGVGLVKYNNNKAEQLAAKADLPVKPAAILPGGNKAVLTMADGTTIALTDAKNGKLATEQGMQVSKAKDGVLVYSASGNAATNAEVAINTITTPRGGQYQVELADGTKVWLNAASSLRFPAAFKGKTRSVELTGEGYFEVAKNKSMPFIVKANGTNVEVLGTHFDVSAYGDDKTVTTTLLEGSVRLVKEGRTAMLIPGQQGVSVNGAAAINVQQADVEQTMAWKSGFFLFRNTYIRDIMKQASRWYDIDVEFEQGLQNKEYGGKISRYKDISELLKNLELTGTIHFKVEGRRITVMQ
ncbi:FecR family protein [Mucilaginibacter pedocola]|uniref:Iron dicitrate transport regulator FecR n=1 Tax=Mucilaginibacter pedocola TaxID=1792845 RepID=A0A1S9P870_9SPHI|nr:FecR family protein [Mucilaginibacter pedocola]OOQ57129.1 hypothetical protein BC343_16545 [Mucilaginibacter pedocola]